ncbi:MAG: YceI family protein [Candidatus Pseudobacter hemicellulosilyticus]|uniref:YceI family protein n=1 Tax=Candidatus Pseudobacter hemicellulosilyticus TaxID=3121375 RepID=A0AAJ6BFV6_9BACT|nr:MAG: YceI family protein [Pseudobacter sp.]
MKKISLKAISQQLVAVLVLQTIAFAGFAQEKYHAKDKVTLTVSGTSTMHDWTMKSSKGEANAVFTVNGTSVTGCTFLSFVTPSESLKSEKSSMDKNAYKALKTSSAPTLSFNLTSATVAADGTVKAQGKLSLAGTTLATELVGVAKVNADKSITVKGSKKISMKEYSIDPPSFMMGAVKTGNDVTVAFEITFTK